MNRCTVIFTALASLVAPMIHGAGSLPKPDNTARMLVVGDDITPQACIAANQRNALITDENLQFTAFFDGTGELVLGVRTLGSDEWKLSRTGQRASSAASVVLSVDIQGYLHVVWGGEGSMNYARSRSPYSTQLGEKSQMDGVLEDNVSEPIFLRLPDRRLLFLYCNSGSDGSRLVLKRYDPYEGGWTTLHSALVAGDGEVQIRAAASTTGRGQLHLAWSWQDNAPRASFHDVCYARSEDGGETWVTGKGESLDLPITTGNADQVVRSSTEGKLAGPPSLGATFRNRVYISSLVESSANGAAERRLFWLSEDGEWNGTPVSEPSVPSRSSGGRSGFDSNSGAKILVESFLNRPDTIYLVYRDSERDQIVVSYSRSPERTDWAHVQIASGVSKTWSPSIDPEQWRRMLQMHLLVQPQGDESPCSLGQLIWSPKNAFWTRHEPQEIEVPDGIEENVEPAAVLALIEKAADWQLANPSPRHATDWVRAPFFIGALELSKISSRGESFESAIAGIARGSDWKPGRRVYHADDHCIVQVYAELARRRNDPDLLQPSVDVLNRVLDEPAPVALHWDTAARCLDRWSWCDALFMAPASLVMLSNATGDPRFTNFMDKEWRATTAHLFDDEAQLYFRDGSYFDLREPNGEKIYWARGNGWVVAGLCRVLEQLPADFRGRYYYRELYRQLVESILKTQQPNGLWPVGLLDPVAHPEKETSGSSFFAYALAWGVNNGLLNRDEVEPAIRRAWNALAACVTEDGKLTHVQPIGAAPDNFDPQNTEAFAVGAFILAGVEVYELYSNQ